MFISLSLICIATVVEEPELESVYGRVDDPLDLESLRNNPHTDCEEDGHREPYSESTGKDSLHANSSRKRSMAVKKTVDCSVQVRKFSACGMNSGLDSVAAGDNFNKWGSKCSR